MKKYFILSVLIMLIGTFTNVQKQNSVIPDNGVNSNVGIESSKGIIATIPSIYTVFSVVPIKNE